MLFIDLLQGFFSRTLQLEFHDIDKFISLQNKIDTSLARVIFCFYIKTN